MSDGIDKVAKDLIRLEREVRALATAPRLTKSSIDNGYLDVKDADGNLRQRIGLQDDGTVTTTEHNGPTPPPPSAPTVTAAQLGLTVAWDGTFSGDAAKPADFDHVEVHLSDDTGFTPSELTLRATLAYMGEVAVTPLATDPHYVVLVAVTKSGTSSDPSTQVEGTPDEVVSTDILDGIVTEVKLANDAVTQAKIAAGAVTETEIANDAVTTPKIVAGAVDTEQLAAAAVLADKIAAGAVTTETIDALAVTADKIAANTITAGQIAAGAITADELSATALNGKTITGPTIRTAESGSRVELNATEDVQSVFFYASDESEAHIAQVDYVDVGTSQVAGSGIEFASSVFDGKAAGVVLTPEAVGLTLTDVANDTVSAQIVVSEGFAALGSGPNGFENQIWVDMDGVVLDGPAGMIRSSATDGLLFQHSDTDNYLWCTTAGTWQMAGAGDVGGPNGGILKLINSASAGNFLELDANEVQANPFGERLHLNAGTIESGFAGSGGVTLGGGLLAEVQVFGANNYPVLARYNGFGNVNGNAAFIFANSVIHARLSSNTSTRADFTCANIARDSESSNSDPAAKADIAPLSTKHALEEVLAAPAYRYVLLADTADRTRRGVMATDVPSDARGNEKDASVDPYGLLATLWAAVQELTNRLEAAEHA